MDGEPEGGEGGKPEGSRQSPLDHPPSIPKAGRVAEALTRSLKSNLLIIIISMNMCLGVEVEYWSVQKK